MLASLERHLGGICEMCLFGFRSAPGVDLCSVTIGSCKDQRCVLGSERLTLPLVKCEACSDVLYWHRSLFYGLDYAQTLGKRVIVFPKIQDILEYLISIQMLDARCHQILHPLGKGSGAFRMGVLQGVSSWSPIRWGHPRSLGSAEILVLLKS